MSIQDDRTTAPEPRRNTGWIVTTAVLAVVAVGLGIWAFSAQSDADDAQQKLDAQQQTAGADDQPQSTASPPHDSEATPAPVEIDPETQQRFEEVKNELGITDETLDQLDEEVGKAVANLERAEQARTDAAGALDRAAAEVEAFKARAAVAQTCLRGTFDALGAAFSEGGIEEVVTELEQLSGRCRSAASP